MPDPLDYACPLCFSGPGEPCTSPDPTSPYTRVDVDWTHAARQAVAESTD